MAKSIKKTSSLGLMSTLIVLLASAGCVKALVEEAISIHQVDILCRKAKIQP
jgi:hypothetical protein